MRRIFLITIISVISVVQLHSQGVLSLEECIRTALSNNYAIIIAKNEQEAARYSRNIGNAGMLPSITLNGGATFSSTSIRQDLSNGNSTSQDGVRSDNYTASAQLTWVLFDGLKMFATYDRLTQLKQQGETATRIQMETTIAEVMAAYYDVVSQNQIIQSIKESITVSEERVKIASDKLKVGSGAKTDLLQAKIDLNTLKSQLLDAEAVLLDRKTTLNRLMVREPETAFNVQDTIIIGEVPDLSSIQKDAVDHNNSLNFARQNIQIQKFMRREINAQRFPVISGNVSYNFSRAQNQAGLFLLNQNYGLSGGFTASFNVFNGWKVNTQYKSATLAYKNAEFTYKDLSLQTQASIAASYRKFLLAKSQSDLEEESMQIAQENMQLSLDRFKQGISNSLELREAQKSHVEAVTRWVGALYKAKTYEIELLRLKGALITF